MSLAGVRDLAVLKFAAMTSTATPAVDGSVEGDSAAQLIHQRGARATPTRVRVLQLLGVVPAALTHHQIDRALGNPEFDRVTLYRVLDWLVVSGLVHRSTDGQRVFRFSAAGGGEHAAHAHFSCEACGRVFCLDTVPLVAPILPDGFALSRLALDLRGRCAGCNGECQ